MLRSVTAATLRAFPSRVPPALIARRGAFYFDQQLREMGPLVPNPKDEVLWEDSGSMRTLWLNRTKALNALNTDMCTKISEYLGYWEPLMHVKGIFLKGADQGRAFCAGGDVRTVVLKQRAGQTKEALDFFRHEYSMNFQMATMKTPLFCIMDGMTLGGGVGISLYARFRIATENTVLGMPECAIGLFPDVGTTKILSSMPGNFGTMLALTGHRLRGRDVKASGFATHFVPSYRLLQMQRRLSSVADFDSSKNDHAVLQQALFEYTDHDHFDDDTGAYDPPEDSLMRYSEHIERAFAPATVEGIMASLAEEIVKAQEVGLDAAPLSEMQESMRGACPLSLKVALKRIQTGAGLTLSEHLKLDFRMATHFLNNPNFDEGIRAKLIDKDNQPKWTPATLEAVSDDMVKQFWEPTGDDLELEAESLRQEQLSWWGTRAKL